MEREEREIGEREGRKKDVERRRRKRDGDRRRRKREEGQRLKIYDSFRSWSNLTGVRSLAPVHIINLTFSSSGTCLAGAS
jgi:hypothetical protein